MSGTKIYVGRLYVPSLALVLDITSLSVYL